METKYFILNNKYNYENGKKLYVVSYLSSNANLMTLSNKMIFEEVMINVITFIQRIFIALYQFLKEKFKKNNYFFTDNRYIDAFYVTNEESIMMDPVDITYVNNFDIISILEEIKITEFEKKYNIFQMEIKQQEQQQTSKSSLLNAKKKYWPVGIKNKQSSSPPPSPSPLVVSHPQIIPPTPEDPFQNELSTTLNDDVNVDVVDLKVVDTNQSTLATTIITTTSTTTNANRYNQDWTPHHMIQKPSTSTIRHIISD